MMTTAKTTVTDTILAIDLGKYKSVACLYFSADDQHFFSCVTSRAEIARLLDKHRPTVVLIEACLLAGWVCDLCTEKGVDVRGNAAHPGRPAGGAGHESVPRGDDGEPVDV